MLYHYTGAAGLMGILGRNVLWATEASYLNDSSELLYSLDMLQDAWSAKFGELGEKVPEVGVVDTVRNRMTSATFVGCLCADGDLLSQWRGYASTGGYAIGFDTRELLDNFLEDTKAGIFAPVSYAPESARRAAERWALNATAVWKTRFPNGLVDFISTAAAVQTVAAENPHEFINDPDFVRNRLMADDVVETLAKAMYEFTEESFGYLAMAAAFHKDPAFAAEEEWRLVTTRPLNSVGMTDGVKFRETQSGIAPYVELTFQKSKAATPIKEIVIGPGRDFDGQARALRMLLLAEGYSDGIKIVASKVPFRG